MYCTNCGSKLPEGVRFCGVCGSPVGAAAQTKTAAASGPRPQPTAPAVPAPRPYQPAPAAMSARPENPKKWPVSAGVLAVIALLLSILRPVATIVLMHGYGTSITIQQLAQVLCALLLTIFLLANTKRIPWLTAIPRSLGVLASLLSTGQMIWSYGSEFDFALFRILNMYLPLLISIVLLVFYWTFTLRKKAPTAFGVILLIVTVLSAIINLYNIVNSVIHGMYLTGLLVGNLIGILSSIATGIAYAIAVFALRESPAPRTVPRNTGAAAYNGQYAQTGYNQPGYGYAQQPPAAQPVYDAPSGGYAALGFFFPVVGLILYLVWKDQTPLRARSAGKGALIGMIVGVVLSILLTIVSVAINASILASLY